MINELRNDFIEKFYKYRRIQVRDIDAGEDPFTYTTGNRGPGYVDVKGGVGIDEFMELGVLILTSELISKEIPVDVIVGMMTGGAIPGYLLKQALQVFLKRRIVYIYQRSEKKAVGHNDLDTGCRENPFLTPDLNYLVVEELVNFGKTTVTGVVHERTQGRHCDHAACLLFYDNPDAKKRLYEANIDMTCAVTLPQVLNYGYKKGYLSQKAYKDYTSFLESPREWHDQHGYSYVG